MPFPFALPTTSSVLLSDYLASPSHPSLPLAATTRRSVVKDALKKYKRLPPQSRASGLKSLQDALSDYISYLLALSTASGCLDVGIENVDVEVLKPFTAEWRATISASLPGREASRAKLVGLHHEIAFVFSTLAFTHSLLARQQMSMLHTSMALSQRTSAIGTAMKHLLEAHSIHKYLLSVPSISAAKDAPADIQPSTISALASLALAEATLVVVSKDDPYAAAVSEDRNDSNKDWMFKAPSIPKVRAHLFARICLAAAEHATAASGLLSPTGSSKVDEDLTRYAADLRRTARGKAARFLAVDTELSGKTGEALAWLKGAKKELGLSVDLEDGKRKGLRGLKQSWQEKREDKKAEKGGEWGLDAGRLEEARVVEMLEAKWDKENSTINVQIVPPFEPLLASMPSGREYHSPQPYKPPVLDSATLMPLRAPPEPSQQAFRGEEEDSGDDAAYGRAGLVGAFPGSEAEYGRSATSSSYY